MPMGTRLDAALLTRPPRLLHALLPGCEWTGPRTAPAGAPVVYLTFDDGPIPEETPWVLEQLAAFKAKATFFCVGQNLERYPEIARATLAAGHRLGNHTHHHRSAWASTRSEYLAGIADCQAALTEVGLESGSGLGAPEMLFRPRTAG
ncbi:polysaccharide deacetylase family protein [Hymenobacter humi]|uniref:Polysaccharide deacetylase family protein n=1 Tax=Hymenobacter humi TaxID=1411620 RepID=A0ABW2U4C0_9BACT